jgi:hypothetical protein
MSTSAIGVSKATFLNLQGCTDWDGFFVSFISRLFRV